MESVGFGYLSLTLLLLATMMNNVPSQVIPGTKPSRPTFPSPSTEQTTPFVPSVPCFFPADIIFVLDGSYSITAADWVQARQFVSDVIQYMGVGVDIIRVGIIVYSKDIGDVVYLTPFRGTKYLQYTAINLSKPSVGRTNTSLALKTMREMFQQQGRPGVPQMGVVITDGQSSNLTKTKDQFTLAKNEGIQLFAIAVGDGLDRKEAMDMASKPLHKYFIETSGYTHLLDNVQDLRNNICSGLLRPPLGYWNHLS